MPSYNVLIAGAGPAGCAAAYDLARVGRRVLLLDRRTFPRPKACACGLTRKTLKALRYSVDPIVERVCHEIILQRSSVTRNSKLETGNSTHQPSADKSQEVRIRSRIPVCAMAVRERFDDFCLQQTLAAGAQLLKIESIAALREFPTHIELDIVILEDGRQHIETLRTPVLIGADGSNGQTRCLEHLLRSHGEANPPSAQEWYTRGFALEALIPYTALPTTLPGGHAPQDLIFDFSPVSGGYGWLFPKGDHINIGVGVFSPSSKPATVPGAPCPDSQTWVSTEASLKQVTRQLFTYYAHQKLGITALDNITGQHLGMGGHAYVPRGRVLLTGDAAGLVDPLTGEGIYSAIVSGQAAAAAILECLPTTLSSRPQRAARSGEIAAFTVADKTTEPGAPQPALSLPKGPDSGAWDPKGVELAAAYARHLRPLKQALAFSHRAAQAFYHEPERGFRAMKLPFLRALVLNTDADGLPHTRLLSKILRAVV